MNTWKEYCRDLLNDEIYIEEITEQKMILEENNEADIRQGNSEID